MMAPNQYTLDTLLTVSLLHDLGKLGTTDEKYYLDQQSQWHRDKGMLYEINPKLQHMSIPHRSLFLAQEHNVLLANEAYLAILLHEGQLDDANKSYKYKEPTLAIILQYAVQYARKLEKDNIIQWS